MEIILSYVMAVIAALGLYPRTGYIVEINPVAEETVEIVVEDAAGLLWAVEGEWDDLEIGDGISMIMYDNETPETILDDAVVSCRYNGFWR